MSQVYGYIELDISYDAVGLFGCSLVHACSVKTY